MATFSRHLYMVFPLRLSRERERVKASPLLSLLLLLERTLILLDQDCTLMTSLNLNHLLVAPLSH